MALDIKDYIVLSYKFLNTVVLFNLIDVYEVIIGFIIKWYVKDSLWKYVYDLEGIKECLWNVLYFFFVY